MPSGARALCAALMMCLGIGACLPSRVFVLHGEPGKVAVGYTGDIEAATAVAKHHCAQFERLPVLVSAEEDVAYFDCVQP